MNPDILDTSLRHLSHRDKYDYLKKAASQVRDNKFGRALKKKLDILKLKH